jgi:hypothetical protein
MPRPWAAQRRQVQVPRRTSKPVPKATTAPRPRLSAQAAPVQTTWRWAAAHRPTRSMHQHAPGTQATTVMVVMRCRLSHLWQPDHVTGRRLLQFPRIAASTQPATTRCRVQWQMMVTEVSRRALLHVRSGSTVGLRARPHRRGLTVIGCRSAFSSGHATFPSSEGSRRSRPRP